MNILSVGGMPPPSNYFWIEDIDFSDLEERIVGNIGLIDVISVGRDSYREVFDILTKHNINNIPIGIHTPLHQSHIQHILNEIKSNGWQEYCDPDNNYDGHYKIAKKGMIDYDKENL